MSPTHTDADVPTAAAERAAGPVELDQRHVVHPMSVLSELASHGATVFAAGKGVRLKDTAGNTYLDGMSGLFNVNAGYGREELAQAAAGALRELGVAPLFFGRGSVQSAELASKLAEITPAGIERFFFTVGGSDATDTAIKVVRFVNIAHGRPEKIKVIARRDSYHGMSFGGWSATGDSRYWENFGPLVPGIGHIGQPDPDDPDPAAELERKILEEGAGTVAAFIAEPISLPSRVTIPPPGYWPRIREICDRHDVLLIADEVITGFGRTGKMFAIEHWDLRPDLMLMSKGLTSGHQPLGAVGMTEGVYAALERPGQAFLHGFTAGGHPAACAVALENLALFERERLVERAAELGQHFAERLRRLSESAPNIGDVRALGMLAGVDVVAGPRPNGGPDRAPGALGSAVVAQLARQRVLLRAYVDTLAVGPALVATEDEVDEVVGAVEAAVSTVCATW